ncbi:MAG: hypothetical protein PVJ92_03300, partial [Candidatus Dependentiae bacterium]
MRDIHETPHNRIAEGLGLLLGGATGYLLNKAADSNFVTSAIQSSSKRYATAAGTTYLITAFVRLLSRPTMKKLLTKAIDAHARLHASQSKSIAIQREAAKEFYQRAALFRFCYDLRNNFITLSQFSTVLPLWNM